MATVITVQPPSTATATAATAATSPSVSDLLPHNSPRRPLGRRAQPMGSVSPSDYSLVISPVSHTPGRDGSTCDACLRRKSRCAMNEMVNKCYSCDFHRQDCTFTLSGGATSPKSGEPHPRKRKLDVVSEDVESVKRYANMDIGNGHCHMERQS